MKNQLEKKNNKSNKNEGITLIALVVTIIVLLILAGISIQMLTGDNGILNRAAEAKENTEQSQLEEQRRLASMEAATNLTETVYNYGEKEIKIPSGYAPTGIEGENKVEDGLVITDSKGNEFVWVEDPNVYQTAGMDVNFTDDSDYLKIAKDLAVYSNSILSDNPTSLADHLPLAGEGVQDYTNEYKDVLKSIYQNGGFWVGRYETGIQGTENATTSARVGTNTGTEYPTEGNVAVIKENVQSYTWVRWGQAQTLAQGFMPTTNNINHANLLMGVQWDLVLKFIGKEKSVDSNSSDWGNYRDSVFSLKKGSHYAKYSSSTLSTTWKAYNEDEAGFVEASEKKGLESGNGILYTTGANITQNSIKNICDIAGNVWEWTIENTPTTSNPCSSRGGGYSFTGLEYPASGRRRGILSYSNSFVGFRVSLY